MNENILLDLAGQRLLPGRLIDLSLHQHEANCVKTGRQMGFSGEIIYQRSQKRYFIPRMHNSAV